MRANLWVLDEEGLQPGMADFDGLKTAGNRASDGVGIVLDDCWCEGEPTAGATTNVFEKRLFHSGGKRLFVRHQGSQDCYAPVMRRRAQQCV